MNKFFLTSKIKNDIEEVEAFLINYLDFPHQNLKESSLHTLKAGGKRIRPAFVLLAGSLFKYEDKEKLISLAAAVELIHMASLIHDDIIDNSVTRRGRPTVRALWGNDFSLYAGGYLFAKAIQLINPKENPRIAEILANTSVEMAKGELAQIQSFFDIDQTVRDYFYRIKRKTALLIAASCEIGALACNASKNEIKAIKKYGYNLGMAFQIQDDILDIESTSMELGKPAGNDLAQGIITLPTIYALQKKNTDSLELKKSIVNRFTSGSYDINKALEIISNSTAMDDARRISFKYMQKAKDQLEYLPKGMIRKNMDQLANYIVERNY
ncbi:heptaprenyl diphosphate synthase [Desulfonispora thiosulfatigenes DSM 11270]|uniref:Heptaprenyl diphosphate synthase n=1 Tax=Desulfonispora thiosulfatigenes DSM 11270 TaxID=656914 RepID=A0A1W1VLC0_DESTI|nr:polyprenyl synthetase family protein [Desulfonispora thiosulfatigenes]SMB94162.1 heptaprenyl diphosphate synthase [Desulfonispora thiosulfatigenes DSM 11270]